MFSRHQIESSAESSIQPWLFHVEPYAEESFGHFLGRFRRANDLSSHHLSALLGQRPYIVSYWEMPSRRRQPDVVTLQRLSQLSGITESRFSAMRSPPGTRLHWPIRLCACCYTEAPYHKLSWQIAAQSHCKSHQQWLLAVCPRCKSAFRLPSYWQSGECDRCYLPFQEMRSPQKARKSGG